MNLLTAEKVSKSFTDKILFDKITLGINENDKIGVLGVNGTGKSTLLKIIAGKEEADEGQVVKGNQVRVEYLPQTPEFDDSLSIIENIVHGVGLHQEGWNVEGEAKAMLGKLHISEFNANPSQLSGGQQKRAALVRALLTPCDLLILDEPTNHLDNEMSEWLEDYLKRFQGAILMVTHDRYFLDAVANHIVEIDKGNLYHYDGNYSEYLMLKTQREEMELATERKKQSLYRQDLEWMMRGARARSTKQKAHIERFLELQNREKPVEEKKVEMGSVSSRLGKQTIEIEHISKSYGEKKLMEDFSYIFLKNDRIGIVGSNGSGKSTLLKMIVGEETPDSGTITIGQTVKIGYFSQDNRALDGKQKVIDYVKEVAEYIETVDGRITASQMLEKFLFFGGMQYSNIEKLSGGEKRRLYLLRVLMSAPNILILDEPTNDLDIQTLTILEDYLDYFDGIVITVSHDRYFLDRIVRRIFAFEGNGKIRQYEGGFTDYFQKIQGNAAEMNGKTKETSVKFENKEKTKNQDWKKREEKLKFTYKEQKEYEVIDQIIADLEEKIEQLEQKIERNAKDFVKLNELMGEKAKAEQELEEKMERWVYLNDLAEKIAKEKESR